MRRLPFGPIAMVGAALLTVLAIYSVRTTSGNFLYVPNKASPVAGNVEVKGHPDADSRGGIYYVDVVIREERWIERILPFLRPDGSTAVAGEAVTSRGETFAERREKANAEMARSEKVAAAVALRAGGLDVTAVPRGVLVSAVATDVPAAGVLEEGDVIVGAGSKPTLTPAALRAAVGALKPGQAIKLQLRRASTRLSRVVKTVVSPDEPGRTVIGIQVEQDVKIELPVPVTIDLGEVGGPSAGLPFALEVLQELGNDVDRGHRVAATGEILINGDVGPVGGLKQKTLGARKAGVDIFLVPAGENAATAKQYAGDLRIVPVESFQQALRVLKTLPAK